MAAYGAESINQQFDRLLIVINIVFMLTILKGFITTYTPDGEIEPVTDANLIYKRYLTKGTMISDIVCQFPFY